jgi:hypothetical protein
MSKKWNDTKCSFCGKSNEQVEKLIAGPGAVYICNECVALCGDMLDEKLIEPRPTPSVPDVTPDDPAGRAEVVRHERRSLLSAKLRALEDLAEINQAVRTSRDRGEAVRLLTSAPFGFRDIEAHTS